MVSPVQLCMAIVHQIQRVFVINMLKRSLSLPLHFPLLLYDVCIIFPYIYHP
jgi:hypothetical protein